MKTLKIKETYIENKAISYGEEEAVSIEDVSTRLRKTKPAIYQMLKNKAIYHFKEGKMIKFYYSDCLPHIKGQTNKDLDMDQYFDLLEGQIANLHDIIKNYQDNA
jgi:hypothetical protein